MQHNAGNNGFLVILGAGEVIVQIGRTGNGGRSNGTHNHVHRCAIAHLNIVNRVLTPSYTSLELIAALYHAGIGRAFRHNGTEAILTAAKACEGEDAIIPGGDRRNRLAGSILDQLQLHAGKSFFACIKQTIIVGIQEANALQGCTLDQTNMLQRLDFATLQLILLYADRLAFCCDDRAVFSAGFTVFGKAHAIRHVNTHLVYAGLHLREGIGTVAFGNSFINKAVLGSFQLNLNACLTAFPIIHDAVSVGIQPDDAAESSHLLGTDAYVFFFTSGQGKGLAGGMAVAVFFHHVGSGLIRFAMLGETVTAGQGNVQHIFTGRQIGEGYHAGIICRSLCRFREIAAGHFVHHADHSASQQPFILAPFTIVICINENRNA